MKVTIAKNSGFCMGVKRAVDTALSLAGENVYVLGEIIHNEGVLEKLEKAGIKTVNSIQGLKEGDTLIIRSHGVGKQVFEELDKMKVNAINLTCPFVIKTQKIVEEYYLKGYKIVIFGKPDHPEVIGLNGWCDNTATILHSNDLPSDLLLEEKVCIVAQTTSSKEKFDDFLNIFGKSYAKTVVIFKTICYTTLERQKEALELSKNCDAMVVIGGSSSSNTKKLYDICLSNCKNTFFVSSPKGLDYNLLKRYKSVGIVSGASTPLDESMEVYLTMSEKIESMEQVMDLLAEKPALRKGDKITVTISEVNDEGLKVYHDGKTEITLGKDQLACEVFEKSNYVLGNELEVIVMSVKPFAISEKEILVKKQEEALVEELKNGKVFNVTVSGFNKGGLTATYEGFSVFVPAGEIKLGFVKELDKYVNKTLRVKALKVEYGKRKKDIVASQKVILAEEKAVRDAEIAAKEEAFFASIAENDVVTGTVARFAKFGAFVVVNGFDCLAHVSDLSWTNVKSPADVLEVGKEYDFVVLKVDKENKKVSIGYKQLQPKPWDGVSEKYAVGDVISGKVVRIVPHLGAFVEVEKGVDGLVHVSQIQYEFLEDASKSSLKVGQEVDVKILAIDVEKEKMNLSIKALLDAPVKEEKKEEKPKKERKAKKENDDEMRGWTESTDSGISLGELLSK
ncbi:MAG: bifunctional 4-hydroxy-3-methylbut-2-enyl diphosphate reductase/30S ribosomal protein S1 [Clostridia bacterium]|nr:bifunctional 4-hydroxy-3-methylbut-2-enyl diphosphate reductase/30S ribosomal protein S1 [Clostridia bacterium]